ncbi:hypothetical protein EVAR_94723_1 [Eumeta japonica]|uniref:Uncharacterized protein n=1 Tax=Eumeta variegata TaxID=151549 RepID=A0A4C1UVM5_EUMVA|nr:hypothetical protein EVAR_94723_1 [Eumeta japonica]
MSATRGGYCYPWILATSEMSWVRCRPIGYLQIPNRILDGRRSRLMVRERTDEGSDRFPRAPRPVRRVGQPIKSGPDDAIVLPTIFGEKTISLGLRHVIQCLSPGQLNGGCAQLYPLVLARTRARAVSSEHVRRVKGRAFHGPLEPDRPAPAPRASR